jgi:hypothetical protein
VTPRRAGRRPAAGAALLLFWCAPQGGAVLAPPVVLAQQEQRAMPSDLAGLAGEWTKLEAPPCAALYPASLRFEPNGLYRGASDPPGAFTVWDVGTWRPEGSGRLALSTANDAVIAYAAALSGDVLTITAPDGCRFSYRRSA